MRLLPLIFFFLVLLCTAGSSYAQVVPDTSLNTVLSDTLVDRKNATFEAQKNKSVSVIAQKEVTATNKPVAFQPNPKKSALYSAILPGSGQFYNRQYWKVGVIYAAVGVGVYFLVDNTTKYQNYRKAYVNRLTNPNYQDEFTGRWAASQTITNLQTLQDQQKKYLDLTYLLTGVGYALQVIDALAFAHLKNFDVSQDISFRLQPVAAPNGGAGLGLVMRF